ncbi:MAG TPA: ComEC/Rec2 family competence protein [Blastocatellia bacterium]|nr:ComEC/Rec2 family competence protein [Blastocatellia bacterium]
MSLPNGPASALRAADAQAGEATSITRRQPMFASTLAVRRQPFLYLAAAFVAGILLDRWLGTPRWLVAPSALAAIALAARFVFVRRATRATFALLAGVMLMGMWLSLQERDGARPTRLTQLFEAGVITADDPAELTGVLLAPPEPAPGAFFLDVEAERLRVHRTAMEASGVVRLIISPVDEEAEEEFKRLALDTGVRLRVLVRLERARRYSNPGSPDFNEFLERRGYDLKGTIKSPLLIEPLGRAKTNRALATLYRMRLRLTEAIGERFDAKVGGTLKAMLVGNRYFLDAQVTERLRESATFHTLVIAGLHIGILAWALVGARWDFWRRRSRHALRRHSAARTFAAIIVLWAYAVMVGLAPPVVRATAMLTIGILGPLMFRRAASINTVSLAAFVMVALKPSLIADPGFQLSFAAVAAIVALALPLIDRLKQIGEWRPTARTPHPPACPHALRVVAETLFWNEREFRRDTRRSPIRYRLEKSAAARWLNRLRLQPLVRAVALLLITSTAIQLATLPLMAVYFNRVSPIGVVLNVTAGLLTAALMLGGLAVMAVAHVSATLASFGVALVNLAHHLLEHSIVPFAGLPLATFRVPHYEGGHAAIYALYFVPLGGLAALLDRWRPVDEFYPFDRLPEGDAKEEGAFDLKATTTAPPRLGAPASLCLIALLASTLAIMRPAAVAPTGRLTVHFLDVGQGDAALIVFPRGATMLVDAGGEPQINTAGQPADDGGGDSEEAPASNDGFAVGEAVVSRFLWAERRTHLDYLLATHADADHIAGFSDVIKNFHVGQALIGHRPTNDAEYDQFARAISQRRIPLGSLAAGERFDIEGVTVEVLWPPRAVAPRATSDNNDSVVLRLIYGPTSILLTGDIEGPAEAALIASGVDLRADVVKVPHHGSKTSSTDTFLDRVRPRCAVISVGERSRFGHPHPAVVERYLSRGIRLLQTGRDGAVTVEADGAGLTIWSYRLGH